MVRRRKHSAKKRPFSAIPLFPYPLVKKGLILRLLTEVTGKFSKKT